MDSIEDLPDRIKQILVERLELEFDPDDLDDDAGLMDDIGIDSAGLLDLVAGLEEEFDVEIDTDEITESRFQSIASLARFVATKI